MSLELPIWIAVFSVAGLVGIEKMGRRLVDYYFAQKVAAVKKLDEDLRRSAITEESSKFN